MADELKKRKKRKGKKNKQKQNKPKNPVALDIFTSSLWLIFPRLLRGEPEFSHHTAASPVSAGVSK